jgi:hypothetical protein
MRYRTAGCAAFGVAALTAALASGCSGGGGKGGSSAPAGSHSSAVASSAPTSGAGSSQPGPQGPRIDPLTGLAPSHNGVVAVKIDDTGNGRPQLNIDKANIVYIEQVEGGLTRLLAVYHSALPTVEAVRSTRASDPELVGSYGPIAYVASGGARNPLSVLDHSPLKTSINDRNGPGFQRDPNRAAPYNLRANLTTIARALKAPAARYVGFRWSSAPTQLSGRAPGVHVRTAVGGTPIAFDYDARTHRYVRSIGGVVQRTAAGRVISASDVLVQFCSVTTYRKDIDVNGNPSKFTHTIGRGRIVLFRNGKRITGAWSRPHYTGPTNFTDGRGHALLFRPGSVWVVLVANGTRLAGG